MDSQTRVKVEPAMAELLQGQQQDMTTHHVILQVLKGENKRVTDALVKAGGLVPSDYSGYTLQSDKDGFFLELTKQAEQLPKQPPPAPTDTKQE